MVKGDSKSSFGLRKFIEDIESISELKKYPGHIGIWK